MKLRMNDLNRVRENIIGYTCGYLKKYPLIRSLVLGISGGADSCLVGLLSEDVCDRMKSQFNIEIKLIGRSISIESNKIEEKERAKAIGKIVCDDFREMDLTQMYYQLVNGIELPMENSLAHTNSDRIRLGNIKARLRMIQLYHIAHANQAIVLSTDNLTEYMLGFWTMHGDVGDYGMIQNLWKTEVYGLLSVYAHTVNNDRKRVIQKIIDAVPTDGLGITDSDLDQFGDVNTYEEVDKILEEYTSGHFSEMVRRGDPMHQVLVMYENTHYKRENPYNIPREHLMER